METVAALAWVFRGAGEDDQLRLLTLEALGDMASPLVVELAPQLMDAQQPADVRKRVVYALSQEGSDAAIGAMLDATREPDIATHVVALLVDQPTDRFLPILRRRERLEQDPDALAVYAQLRSQIEERL